MVDVNKILAGLTNSGFSSGLAGGIAGGALSGALMSKKGRKSAGTLLKVGGVAAVGALAWNAYQNYQRRQTDAPAAAQKRWRQLPRERFDMSAISETAAGAEGMLLVRAMITAAMSDGHLDASEQRRIFDRIDELELGADEEFALLDELRNPRLIEEIVAEARDPAVAIEVYAASVLAIDETTERGMTYLQNLRLLLRLPDDLVAAVHDQTRAAPRANAAA